MTQPAGSSPTEPGAPAASGLPDVEVADARARATTEATVPAGWTRRFVVGLALIGLVGLGVRVAYILVAKSDGDACGQKVCGDAYYYSLQAEVIAQGDGFERPFTGGEAADHPPLTALVATPAAMLAGENTMAQRLTMALVGTGAVVMIGLLGRAVAGDRAA